MTVPDAPPPTPDPSLAAAAVRAIGESFAEVRDQTLEEATEQAERLRTERDELAASLQSTFAALEDRLTTLRNEQDTLVSQQEVLEEEASGLRDERDALQAQLTTERDELERLAKDSSDAAAAVQRRLRQDLDEARAQQQHTAAQKEQLEEQLEASREQVNTLENRLQQGSPQTAVDVAALLELAPALRRALTLIDSLSLGPKDTQEPSHAPSTDAPDQPTEDTPPPPQPEPSRRRGSLPAYALPPHEAFRRPVLKTGLMLFNGWVHSARPDALLESARNWVLYRKNGNRRDVIPRHWNLDTLTAGVDLVQAGAAVRLRQSEDGRGWFLHFHEAVGDDARWHTLIEVAGRGSGSLVRLWSGNTSSRGSGMGALPYFLRGDLEQVSTMGPGFPYGTRHRVSLSKHDVSEFAEAYFEGSAPYFSTVFLGNESRFPKDLHSRLLQTQRLPSNPALVFGLQDQEAAHALREALEGRFPGVRIPSTKAFNRQVTFVSSSGGVAVWDRPEVRAIHTEQVLGHRLISTLSDLDARWLELLPPNGP